MHSGPCILVLCLFALSTSLVWTKKTTKSCASETTDYGFVCVCNSTYCDTIAAPTKQKSGKYYHYYTSETSAGFNVKKGSFGSAEITSNYATTEVYVTVDSNTTYQTLVGVGAGFSDSAAYVYNQLSTEAQANLIASFFGSEGIELTFGRVSLGGTDFSLSDYSFDDTDGDVNMTDFALTTFETETRIPFILSALSATERTLNLLATPWSTPYWMKDNNSTEPGFLIPSYQEAFTNYIIKFLDAHKEYGIEYWGLSPMNEVIFCVEARFSMPNVIMLPNQVRSWIRDYVGPMLEDAGYEDVKILALDDERPYLTWYGEALLSDNETAQYIDGFAVHWYSDSDSNTDIVDEFHEKYPDVFVILTEASGTDAQSSVSSMESIQLGGPGPGPNPTGGSNPTGSGPFPTGGGGGGGGVELGSWATAEKYIDSIIQNYQHWSVGYMAWNMVLNTEGGPYLQMSQEAPILVNTTTGEFYKQPFYYALGHFSKFMYPDSVRVDLTVSSDTTTVAYADLQKKKTTTTTTTTTTENPQPTGGNHSGGPGPNPTGGSFTGGHSGAGPNPTGGSHTGGHSGGPNPQPTGGSHTGGHSGGPNPQPTGGSHTGGHSGGPNPNPTSSSESTFSGVASTNPDGSTTVILFNPSSDEVTVVITDTNAGTITTTVEANSLNTFIYW